MGCLHEYEGQSCDLGWALDRMMRLTISKCPVARKSNIGVALYHQLQRQKLLFVILSTGLLDHGCRMRDGAVVLYQTTVLGGAVEEKDWVHKRAELDRRVFGLDGLFTRLYPRNDLNYVL
jgi:hypothetical protein